MSAVVFAPRRLLVTAMLLTLVWLWHASPAEAQSVWDLSPYRVRVYLEGDPAAISAGRLEELSAELRQRSRLVIGPAWQLEVAIGRSELAPPTSPYVSIIEPDAMPEGWPQLDKVFVVRLSAPRVPGSVAGLTLAVRECDVATLHWGIATERRVSQPLLVADELFRAIHFAFTPVARVDKVEGQVVTLRRRAAMLPPRDERAWQLPTGGVFRAVLRITDRDGATRRLQPVGWTYLVAKEVAGPLVTCDIHSGIRTPLSVRRKGRAQQLAIGVIPPATSTTLTLVARDDPAMPLAGYDVDIQAPPAATAVGLGRTDRRGQIVLTPNPEAVRVLMIRSGNEMLARLPVVPGLEETLIAPIPNDNARLAVEGFIVGLQETIVDQVARREVLLTLAKKRIETGKADEVEPLLKELRQLPTRDQFAQILDERRKAIVSTDPQMRKRIDKLFDDTRTLLAKYLDPTAIAEVEAAWRARQEAG